MLIEILVEVMEPTYVCSVSSECGFLGTQPGVLCEPWKGSRRRGPWARGSGMGREEAKKMENQALSPVGNLMFFGKAHQSSGSRCF